MNEFHLKTSTFILTIVIFSPLPCHPEPCEGSVYINFFSTERCFNLFPLLCYLAHSLKFYQERSNQLNLFTYICSTSML